MSIGIIVLNLGVLAAVLANDLGHRRLTARRIVRPLVISAVVIAFFVGAPALGGAGLALEAGGAVAGLLLGGASSLAMRVDRSHGEVMTSAGAAYAAVWTILVALRLGFAWGAQNVFGRALGQWMASTGISAAALTDAFILFSIGMVVARTLSIAARAWLPASSAGRVAEVA